MLETTRQNFDVDRIMSNMAGFKGLVGEYAKCYREKKPSSKNPVGIIVVGLEIGKKETETLIDQCAKEHNASSPYGWQKIDPRNLTYETRFEAVNGYKFT